MKAVVVVVCLIGSVVCRGQENARILSQHTHYDLRSEDHALIQETYRLRINNDKAKRYGYFVNFVDKFRKINDVTVEIFDMNGKRVKKLKRSDGHELGFNASYEITDGRLFFVDPEYQNYPYIIEITSTIELNGYMSLPPWVPRDNFNLAVDQSKLTVTRPQSLNPAFKEEFITGVTTTTEDGKLMSTYEVTGLPAVERKQRFSDFYDKEAKVLISPRKFKLDDQEGSFASWSTFGDWFLKLNSEPYALDPKTVAFISQLNKSDTKELIRQLYVYMQDKTRYVSIQLGIGGFKSLPTEMVEKFGYGDCKALSTYMKNMLDHAGVKSNYILVQAGPDVANVEADFPSNQFNHVYIGVPLAKDTVYLECTSQTAPSNYTGTFTDDRNVLWVEGNSSRIIRSRIYPHTQNIRKTVVDIKLDAGGDATITNNQTSEGIFFDEIMIYQNAPESYVKDYNQSKFQYPDFTVKSFNYKQPERNHASFTSTFAVEVKGLAKMAGNKLVFPLVPATPFKRYVNGDDMMKYYEIKRGLTLQDEIEVEVPANFWIYSLPEKENIKSRFGSYSLETEFDGTKLKIKRTVVLYKGDYTEKNFEEFRAFYQQMDKLENRKLVFNSKT